MNWLLALLAFAGLMTILSTVVTISVEALHKVFSLRKSGLQEMLRALHDGMIEGVEREELTRSELQRANGRSETAARFANTMTRSPSYGGAGRWWWISNWGVNLFQRNFERLTPRQFAEQLAQTEFGQNLAERSRSQVRHTLSRASYEFNRIGVAQSAYFRQRAKVISGLTAFAFVCLGNVNLIEVYMHLSNDQRALSQTLSLVDAQNTATLQTLVDPSAMQTEAVQASSTSTPIGADQFAEILQLTNGQLQLPIGRDYFPFCEDTSFAPGNCDGEEVAWYQRLIDEPQEGIVWFLSLVASAGLLALGAPFWFDLFSKTAALVGRAATQRAIASGQATAPRMNEPRRPGDRDENPELEELTDAFMIASGLERAPLSAGNVVGMRLGPASSEAMTHGVPMGPPPDQATVEAEPSETPVHVNEDDDHESRDPLGASVHDVPQSLSTRPISTTRIRGVHGRWTRR